MQKYMNFIDGKWIESQSKETIKVDDPATGKIIGEISCAKKDDVDLAVDAAKKSFESRVLVDMPLLARAKLMRRIADETRKIAKEGGELLCYENGKTLGAAVKEFNDVADMFDYYAGLTDKLEGKTIPVSKNVFDYTVLEPFGVSAHVVPWNYPLAMVGRSLSCSFATGNSTVIKTAELTPLSATVFAQALINAEVPNGLINIICGYGNEAGSYLVSHEDVNHVVFTGSVATGKKILHACADKAIPAVVELGGKSAGIVYPDADLNDVLDSARHGIFGVAGQICTAMSRLVVHKSIKDELVNKLVDLSKSLKVGPGIEKDTDLTPVISENQLQKVEGYARSGIQEGAEAAHGGKRLERDGYFMEPTILNNVKQEMTVAREEIFGPVLSILEYEDQEEAIKIANDTDYGLGSGVFTKDLKKASWTASKLEAGQVYVNKWFTGNHATPFGGYKQSGYSREKGVDGLKSYLQVKNVGISLS
ncbi:aldehyde dehydrogenase family protein [Pelagibacteraceae bacterium]|nr:aldehyde dehydrogenase family protein [Pelagibacteraceae bacterium]